MPKNIPISFFLVALLSLLVAGCGSAPIQHLNSDVAQLKKGNSQAEVMAIMGAPTRKWQEEDREQWIYIVPHKSFMKRLWLINHLAGTISYEIVRITFVGDAISKYSFRYAKEEEFNKSGLASEPPKSDDEF